METPRVQRRRIRWSIVGGLTLVVALGLSLTAARPASATPTCTKTWTGASSSNWTTSGNWSPSGAPGATDFVCISSGTNSPTMGNTTTVSIAGLELDGLTLTVNGSLTMTDTTGTKFSGMTAGALQGSGAVTVAAGHTLTWTGGTMQGSGSTVVASGGTLTMDDSASFQYLGLDTRTLTNNGTATYKPSDQAGGGAALILGFGCTGNPTSFVNNGTFTYNGQNTNDAGIGSQCGTNTITNNGTFTKATGGTAGPIAPLFNNAGTVTAQTGSLALTGGSGGGAGSFGATGGASLSLAGGTFNLSNGSAFTGGVSIDGAAVSIGAGATLTMTGSNSFTAGSIEGAGTVQANGTLIWTGGTMQGAGSTVVGASGTLTMDDSASVQYLGLDTRTLTNNGTASYKPSDQGPGGAALYLGFACTTNPTSFVNNGTFTYIGQNTNDAGIGSQCGDNIIKNTGTLTRSAGTGGAIVAPAFDNDGTVSAAAGTLSFTGGGGTGQSATGQFGTSGSGKISLDAGTYHLSTGASFLGEGAIGGATVSVDGSVSVSNMAFTGGTIDGSGALSVNGTLTWTGGTMQGNGSTVVASGGTLTMDDSASVQYLGLDTRTLTNNGTASYKPSDQGPGGAALYLGFACTTNPTSFVNNGTFTYIGQNTNDAGIGSQCGTNTITNNGTFTKATGSGSASVGPDVDNNGSINGNAGTLLVAGAFPAYNSGTSTLVKGTLTATANLQINAVTNIVHNAGSITLNGASANIKNGSAANALSQFNDNQATGSFTVTGGKSLAVKPMANAGTVTVGTSSTLSMNNGPYTQAGGTTTDNGNLTSTGTGAAVAINGGTLQGSGTVTPSVTSSGTVRPGTSPGILSIAGSYTQNSGGTLAIEIGGTSPGTGYDQLNATGAATLNGTLSLSTINAFTPSVGQTYTIMSYASHTGCFTTINGRDLGSVGAGLYYDLACNATNAVLTVKRAELSISDVTVTEGNSGTLNANFTVSLNQARPDLGISVSEATADGTATAPSDYTSTSGPLTWAAGDGTSRTVSVPVVGDTLDENDEAFMVNLSSATNAFILDNQGVGTIQDNDPPPSASINDVSASEGNSGTTSFSFTVTLSAASGKSITIDYATADGTATAPTDYTAGSGTLTFDAGTTTQPVAVSVNGDTTTEPDETFVVNLSTPVNVTIADSQGQGTILNDDTSAAPIVTGYNPTAAKQKKPVTILGSAFTGATQVAFSKAGGGTVNATTFSVTDDGHIATTVPSLATTGPVFVTTPAGTNATAPTLKIKPTVKSFTPASGPVGTVVTITGTAFTGATKVQFNGVSATFTVNSDTKITATVPVGATTGKITVVTLGGKGVSKAVFTVT